MPRVYVRKRETKYSIEDLQRAVKDVEDKRKTYRQAEEYYNVPISVIYHRIKGRKININRMGAGVSKVLTDRVENHIVSCLKVRAQMGHPVLKEELKLMVKEYLDTNRIKTVFKDNKPGDDWYIRFMKRHPELSLKKPEQLQKARKDARKPFVIYSFYDLLKSIVEDNLRDKPMYIYNCDESGFQSDPSKMRAIGQKGKPLYRVSGGSGRESTTVLACVSADGLILPPLIVFKGAAVQARWTTDKSFPGTLYAATKNGWMEEPVFFNWLTKSFIAHINTLRQQSNEPDQKALLIYDGHSSHISVRIIEAAEQSNISLLKFPSHLTDRIQPLDKCVFGPVKKTWDKKLIEYGVKQMGQGSGRLTKKQFAELLGEVYTIALKPKNIISGFTTTGLYPVDPSKFPKNLFNSEDLNTYNALFNNQNDDGQQLTPVIDEEQLDLERYYRENKQTNNKNTQPVEIRSKQLENLPLEKEGTEKEQMNMLNEKIDINIDQPRVNDIHNTEKQETATDNKTKALEKNSNKTQKRQMVNDNNVIKKKKKTIETNKQTTITETLDENEKVSSKNDELVEIEQIGFLNDDIVTQEEIEIEEVDSQMDESVEIEQIEFQDLEMVTQEEVEQIDFLNDETVTQEEIETEQVDMQNKVIVEIDTQTEKNLQKDTNEKITEHTKHNSTGEKDARREQTNMSMINNIMKIISLDTTTNSELKQKVVSGIMLALNTEKLSEIPEESPNKQALQKIFRVSATPEKAKKLVVPRLKQSAFGEVLTSEEVKERLRLAEEKKLKSKKSNTKTLKDITNKNIVTKKNTHIKGKGKKTKAETKKKINKKIIIKTKNKKQKLESEDSESEIEMSTHSDSDIVEAMSDINEDIDLKEKETITTIPAPVCTSPVAGSSKPEKPIIFIDYSIEDNVLVRYIFKKKVEYFVGKIINKANDTYNVSFYKRLGRNDNTRFIIPKNEDIDSVLPNMIVKKVNLLAINAKETEFVFLYDEDLVYFD